MNKLRSNETHLYRSQQWEAGNDGCHGDWTECWWRCCHGDAQRYSADGEKSVRADVKMSSCQMDPRDCINPSYLSDYRATWLRSALGKSKSTFIKGYFRVTHVEPAIHMTSPGHKFTQAFTQNLGSCSFNVSCALETANVMCDCKHGVLRLGLLPYLDNGTDIFW